MDEEKFKHHDMHKAHLLITCDEAGLSVSTQKGEAHKPGVIVYFDFDEAETMYEALGRMLGCTNEPQEAPVHEETLADFIADTHDKYGPECDELSVAQELLRAYSITRPE